MKVEDGDAYLLHANGMPVPDLWLIYNLDAYLLSKLTRRG